MIVRLKLAEIVAHQDPWPPETEPSTMQATMIDVELVPDCGDGIYTLGRLFFAADLVARLNLESVEFEMVDNRKETANV